MSKVIIFGAGGSKYAGVPLQEDLINKIIKFLYEDNLFTCWMKENIFNESLKYIVDEVQRFKDIDLLFSVLDYLILQKSTNADVLERRMDYIVDSKIKENIGIEADQSRFFKNADLSEIKGIKMLLSTSISNILAPRICNTGRIYDINSIMVKMLKNAISMNEGDIVISFNYDLLIDQALWRTGKWSPVDGYALENHGNLKENDLVDTFQKVCPKSHISLFKLHGSINWESGGVFGIEQDRIEIKTHEKRFGYSYFHGIPNTTHTISYPPEIRNNNDYYNVYNVDNAIVLFGYIREERFCYLWEKAKEYIKKANEIYIIGYSCPDADVNSKQLIEAAGENTLIKIIDPKANAIGKKIKGSNNVQHIEQSFENWVDTCDRVKI